jgi:hypothetical protein
VLQAGAHKQQPDPWLLRMRSEAMRCTSRSWLALQTQVLALGPRVARAGDLIVVLNGSSLPCMVREKGRGGYFELVGQCYVDGVMYGEGVDWGEEESETFWLV